MDTLRQFVTRTRVEGLVILLVSLSYLWEAGNVPELYQIPGVPGPSTFPRLLGLVFALSGVWLMISPKDLIARRNAAAAAVPVPAASDPLLARLAGHLAAKWHFYLIWIIVLVYLWVMPDLGFPLATFLLLLAFTYLLGETRWPVVVAIAVAATAIIYVCFKMGLNVRLPLGVLEPLFK